MSPSKAFRDRSSALGLVAVLHVLAVFALLNAVIIAPEPRKDRRSESETEILLLRETPAPQPPERKRRRPTPPRPASGGSNAISAPYFNPYAYQAQAAPQGSADGIALALSACNPGRYDMAAAEVRAACDRIGMLVKNDPGHFGVVSDVVDPKHWQRELARREAPHLLPCMKAHAPPPGTMQGSVAMVDLATLLCISRILFVGYDSEKHEHYSQ